MRRMLQLSVLLAAVGLGCSGDNNSPTEPDVSCSEYPAQSSSAYVLPWQVGEAFTVGQTLGHGGPQRFAVDVLMPIGTTLLAARAGEVVRVEESFVDGDNVFGHENYILIQHDDGTVARYIHLTNGGSLAEIGDDVDQGEAIAVSGNTGNSTAPHLHFDVAACCCAVAPNYNARPCGQTQALTFRNTQPHPCGLQVGETYTAG